MMTDKQNLLNFYHRKPLDHFETYLHGARFLFEANGFLERPPHQQSGKDWFGVSWIYDPSEAAFVPDHREPPVLKDICEWRDVVQWPDLDSMDWEAAVASDHIENIDRENFVFSVWDGCGPFERLHMLMGFEEALMALITEPEEVAAFMERFTEYKTKLLKYICEYYKPDVMQFQDDAGTNKGTFYSPEVWRELIKPVWQAEIDVIHSCGVAAELHSCGNNTTFFSEMGDMGLDVLFIQPINDIQKIREATGGKINFMVQTSFAKFASMLASGSIDEANIRKMAYEETKENLLAGSGNDYLILAFPPVMDEAGIVKVSADNQVNAIIWDELMKHMDEFTEIVRKKNNLEI